MDAASLIVWYRSVRRDLPWRRTRDPWLILMSEMMLQQTRVTTVLPYYEKFATRFPTFGAMAEAPEEEVLTLWAGLGYYSRARNLQRAAQALQARGAFPRTYEELKQLPGVGDYTAAAVASIAFGAPTVVLDGNVLRVMSRIQADPGDIKAPATRARLKEAAQSRLDPKRAGEFNQALMELGATLCTPMQPKCLLCPWCDGCEARKLGRAVQFPVKRAGRAQERVDLELLWIEQDGKVLLWQRGAGERRLAGFWELPEREQLPDAEIKEAIGGFRHGITHHDYHVELVSATHPGTVPGFFWKSLIELPELPLSTMTKKSFRIASACIKQD